MVAVVFLLTAAVLALVQARMREHVREDVVSTLRAESSATTQIEAARRAQAHQGAALIADQPILKALMSTNDRLTVEDGSESLLQTSHADILVLENRNGEMLAFHSRSDDVPASAARRMLQESTGEQDWWYAGGHLFHVSFAPIVAGADVNQTTEYAWTPLLVATNNRNYKLGAYLMENGADVNLANKGLWTPLYLATDNRNIEGGDYPVRNPDMDHFDYIKLLIEKGANVNAHNKRGFTPLDIAMGKGGYNGALGPVHDSIAAMLRQAGGEPGQEIKETAKAE